MKNIKTNGRENKLGFSPIKAQNPIPKTEPKSTVTKTGGDMRVKVGK